MLAGDAEAAEIVVTSPFLLAEGAKAKLRILVSDVICGRPLTSFEPDGDAETDHPKAEEKKRGKRDKGKTVKDVIY